MRLLESRRWTVAALVLFLTNLTGCALDLKDPFNDRAFLDDTQKEFSQSLRWGAIEKAAAFVVPEQRAEFDQLKPTLSELRITDYEMMSLERLSDTEAKAAVRYRGYTLSSPIERSIVINETWILDPATHHWMVRLEVARLRKALGLAAR